MRRSLILLSILLSVASIRLKVRAPERRIRMLMHRRLGNRDEVGHRVCFDLLGCFTDRQQPLPIKRPPQHPSIIKTQFLLYTRENRNEPQALEYGDQLESMHKSRFNGTRKLKAIIHGFKGSGSAQEGMIGVQAFLDLEDANVIVVDWARGAGSNYGTAVSNTELVGRQLGLILLDAVQMGIDPNHIHLIGFSLGAHVAGCASEVLKKHNIFIGRITGLDPASPFFRHHLFREKTRKLDISDAKLVDVIHTDGSTDFADGFGLLKPIGHVDFFPNGGRQQPGCNDVKNSVVVSHLNEDSLDIHIACSHARSWFLFVESLRSQRSSSGCRFESWPCKRRFGSYAAGSCFPPESITAAPEMGYAADAGPPGLYYLPTRAEYPFCGRPLRAAIRLAEANLRPKGLITMTIRNGESVTTFGILCDQNSLPPLSSLNNRNNDQPTFYNIQSADFDKFIANATTVQAQVRFDAIIPEDIPPSEVLLNILIEKFSIEDRKGNRWESCGTNFIVGPGEVSLTLNSRNIDCEIR